MAHQENACWRCGTHWATEDRPLTTLRVVPREAPPRAADAPQPGIAAKVRGGARAATQAGPETDRWVNEGGSLWHGDGRHIRRRLAGAGARSRRASPNRALGAKRR